mmetsp:Transcript_14509/g.20581  ORF Transcript_14509/g.20581 Transcript_14509/m.20581 type:complete len:98 (-) Transcript_14509:2188-2481(-)
MFTTPVCLKKGLSPLWQLSAPNAQKPTPNDSTGGWLATSEVKHFTGGCCSGSKVCHHCLFQIEASSHCSCNCYVPESKGAGCCRRIVTNQACCPDFQ